MEVVVLANPEDASRRSAYQLESTQVFLWVAGPRRVILVVKVVVSLLSVAPEAAEVALACLMGALRKWGGQDLVEHLTMGSVGN